MCFKGSISYKGTFSFSVMALTTDQFFDKIGSFGRYQIFLIIFFNLCYALWWAVPIMIMVFIASEPNWKCKNNSTCPFTKSISIRDEDYKFRCNISRDDWEYVDDFTSVVTEVRIEVFQVHISVDKTPFDLLKKCPTVSKLVGHLCFLN